MIGFAGYTNPVMIRLIIFSVSGPRHLYDLPIWVPPSYIRHKSIGWDGKVDAILVIAMLHSDAANNQQSTSGVKMHVQGTKIPSLWYCAMQFVQLGRIVLECQLVQLDRIVGMPCLNI